MLRISLLFISFLIISFSVCHPDNTEVSVCLDRDTQVNRPCTSAELLFIKDWNLVVKKINAFDINEFEKKFLSVIGGNQKYPNIVMLGEQHNHIDGELENWGYLAYLAKRGKVNVLQEGGESGVEYKNSSISKIGKIVVIIINKRLADDNIAYHPTIWDKLSAERYKETFYNFLSTSKHLMRISFMENMVFSYWDKQGEADDKYINLERRNLSLLNSVTKKLREEKNVPVAVLAGFEHLPLGDYYVAYTRIPKLGLVLPPDFAKFYTLADKFRARRIKEGNEKFYEERIGASRVIYEGLSKLAVNTIQAIPRSTLKIWEELVQEEGK